MARVTALSAVTLATADMAAATTFYEALGFEKIYGGPQGASPHTGPARAILT